MDTDQFHACAKMIDEVDLLIAKSRTKTGRNGKILTLSNKRQTGPRSQLFLFKKRHLLATLRSLFIEASVSSLKFSALSLFCYQCGLKLLSYTNKTHVESTFTIRTPNFDLVVTSL